MAKLSYGKYNPPVSLLRNKKEIDFQNFRTKVLKYVKAHPEKTFKEIGDRFDRSPETIGQYAKLWDLGRKHGNRNSEWQTPYRQAKENVGVLFSRPLHGRQHKIVLAWLRTWLEEQGERRQNWITFSRHDRVFLALLPQE